MKTRIIHTKLHFEDNWFNTLPIEYKYPFIYLFTNAYIGLTGTYYLSERVALLETGMTKELWEKATKHFQNEKKIGFYKEWVCVTNSRKYANYSGSKNAVAFNKEIDSIPLEVKKENFTYTLYIPYVYSSYTPINNKSKIINQKKEDLRKKFGISE
jgi:hypothetical protein